jgi:hypothetical protein
MKCRSCGAEGVVLTVIWKPDKTGTLRPVEGVCHHCTRKPAVTARPGMNIMVARFRGWCSLCNARWMAGDDFVVTQDEQGKVYLCTDCAR